MSEHDYLRYGTNEIRGYVDDELHLQITPRGIEVLQPDDVVSLTITSAAFNVPSVPSTMSLFRLGNIRFCTVNPWTCNSVGGSVEGTHTVATPLPDADWPKTDLHTYCTFRETASEVEMIGRISIGASDGQLRWAVYDPAMKSFRPPRSGATTYASFGMNVPCFFWYSV